MIELTGIGDAVALLLVTLQQAGAQSVTEPLTNSLNQFANTIVQAGPKIIAALVLLGIGLLVGRIIGWAVKKVTEKMNVDEHEQNQHWRIGVKKRMVSIKDNFYSS